MSAGTVSFYNSKDFWSIHNQAVGCEWGDLVDGIFKSIENRDKKEFPYAQLNMDGSVSFILSGIEPKCPFAQKLTHEAIIGQIEYYTQKNGISPIDGRPLIEVIPYPEIELTEFRFNLTPDQLDTILKINSHYSGYKGEFTVLKLNKKFELSGETIRLFPVYPVSEGEYIVRAAGCQMSETISVQLLKLLPDCDGRETRLHWVHTTVEEKYSISSSTIGSIINKILTDHRMISQTMYLQSDGLYTIQTPNLDSDGTVRIVKMTPDTQTLYQMYGNCSKEELDQCDSLEITRDAFFKYISAAVEESAKWKALS